VRFTLRIAGTIAVVLIVSSLVASSAYAATVVVKSGDTISSIAHDHSLSVGQLLSLNGSVRDPNLIKVGQVLNVPDARSSQDIVHKVVPGDTLIGLSRQFGVPVSQISSENHLGPAGTIYVGTTLVIGQATASDTDSDQATSDAKSSPVPAPRSYPPAVVAAAARDRSALASEQVPSPAAVRSLVDRVARQYGVDPALALAVSDQESGFQQQVVSDADAIGAMQVVPSTARQLSSVAGRSLDPMKTEDNVVAGVLLLRLLTRAAPLDQAIAGYYQGLGSVRTHGMYRDTRSYVADVLALKRRFAAGQL
jgi:LysM repeat protein